MSEEQRNGSSATGSSQESTFFSNQDKGRVEEEAILVAIHEIKTNSNNRKASPMVEDLVTLEEGGAKEDVVNGKGTNM